jgi:hypothetical protein
VGDLGKGMDGENLPVNSKEADLHHTWTHSAGVVVSPCFLLFKTQSRLGTGDSHL